MLICMERNTCIVRFPCFKFWGWKFWILFSPTTKSWVLVCHFPHSKLCSRILQEKSDRPATSFLIRSTELYYILVLCNMYGYPNSLEWAYALNFYSGPAYFMFLAVRWLSRMTSLRFFFSHSRKTSRKYFY
jgi:hypothetical protein